MEQSISRLLELSTELSNRIETCGFEDIKAYMDRRNEIFTELQAAPEMQIGEDEKRRIKRLAEVDQAIMGRMQWLHRQIGSEIERIQIGKKSRMMYERDEPSYEGDFFDSRS